MKRKIKYVLVVLLFLVGGFLLYQRRDYFFLESTFKDFFNGVEAGLEAPFKQEGKEIDLALSRTKDEELSTLKSLLELKTVLSRFDLVYASSIYRNVAYFNNTITLDKGKSEGMKEQSAVVTSLGLVGRIDKVMEHSSVMKLLTSDEGLQLSVVIHGKKEDYYGVLSTYDRETGLFLVTGIPSSAEIEENSEVVTSGLGGVFPSGIYVGFVESSKNDSFGITKNIKVRSKQDFNDIKYVAVLMKEEEA